MLYKLARFSVRHRFAVVAVWLLLAVVLVGEGGEFFAARDQLPAQEQLQHAAPGPSAGS